MSTPRSEFVKSAPWYPRATALSMEDIMTIGRRTFLKGAGLTMGAGVLGPSVALAAQSTPAPMAGGVFLAEDKIEYGPCVTNPEKIVCIGLNYRKHAAETGNPVPKAPILFNKYNTALNCCGGEIAVSKEKAVKFDYEAELVIVIGRTSRNVAEADALAHIFVYFNDTAFT